MTLIRKSLPLLPLDGRELLSAVREADTGELALAESYISAAQNALWTHAQRAAHVAKYELTLPCFPSNTEDTQNLSVPFTNSDFALLSKSGIELRVLPFLSIESVTYVDKDGASQTLATTDYVVLDGGCDKPSTLYTVSGVDWPATREQIDAVTITFWAGETNEVSVSGDTLTSVAGYTYADGDEVTISHSGNFNAALMSLGGLGLVVPLGTTSNKTYYVINAAGASFGISETVAGAAVTLETPYDVTIYAGTLSPLVRRVLIASATDWWLNRCPSEDCSCLTGDAARAAMRFDLVRWNTSYGS